MRHILLQVPTPGRRGRTFKVIPETRALREEIKAAAGRFTEDIDKTHPFTRDALEQMGRQLLRGMGHPERYLGFTMVQIGNSFWKRQFIATPFERRLLLLPHTNGTTSAGEPPGNDRPFRVDTADCSNGLAEGYRARAEELGYQVMVAQGDPGVLKVIVEGHVDGILGVASLNDLEKAIDQILIAGVPSYAVPLQAEDGAVVTLDESWIWDVLEQYEPLTQPRTASYLSLMRAANRLFDDDFDRLLPRVRSNTPEAAAAPLGQTEDIAYDWLANGGKRFRPFITLAAWQALREEADLSADDPGEAPQFPDAVARVAIAIEAFHKASLVHDDIQDDDLFRYGRETLHRAHGMGPAINIGDYLIGLGYRLVNSCRDELGAEVAADIVDNMSRAHIKLCDGQGAEMSWQHRPDWAITPLDALQIYALKTSPAFEAALYAGLRMSRSSDVSDEMIPQFARHLGVGFQVLNDLNDWREDDHNKLVAGQDALALRPTVLLALALESATQAQRLEIREILESVGDDDQRVARLRTIFADCGAFTQAAAIVDTARRRAEALTGQVSVEPLRRLLHFLVETVLAPDGPGPTRPPDAANVPQATAT